MKDTSSKKNNMKAPHKRILRAMELWRIYGAVYSTAVKTYRALLERKRELKITPLNRIPEYVLKEYPDIKFLKICKSEEAEIYLMSLDALSIDEIIHQISYMVEYDYAYRTVTNRVKEYEYQIRHHGERTNFGLNPDCIGTRRGTKSRASGRNVRIDETK